MLPVMPCPVETNPSTLINLIVPAVEIVQPRLGIVVIPPVAEGVFVAHGVAGGVGDSAFAPGVVAVLSHDLPRGGPDDGYNIPLDIVEVVEQHGTVGKAHALAGAVVEEPHDRIPGLLRQNLAAVEEEFRGGAVDRFRNGRRRVRSSGGPYLRGDPLGEKQQYQEKR